MRILEKCLMKSRYQIQERKGFSSSIRQVSQKGAGTILVATLLALRIRKGSFFRKLWCHCKLTNNIFACYRTNTGIFELDQIVPETTTN
jgi:hypothetical protein